MSKSLHTIQVLAKLGKIFSQIVFVFSLVGGIGCCVGFASLMGMNGLVIGGTDITALIVTESDRTMETLLFSCVSGLIACAAECVLSKFANIYFKRELESGTPFTNSGSREIRRLGILAVVLPLGARSLEGIVYGVYSIFYPMIEQEDMGDMTSVSIGVMFIVASVIFQYGTELKEQNEIEE